VVDTPSEITQLLDKHYCDRGDFGRWLGDGGHEKLVQAAAAINDRTAAINRVLKSLSLSHTQLFTPDSVDYHHLVDTYAPLGIRKQLAPFFPTGVITYPGIEILTEEHDDRYFVAAVATRGAGDKSGLILGDELVAIDGVPFAPVERFRGREGRSVVLSYRRRPDGPVSTTRVVIRTIQPSVFMRRASLNGALVVTNRRSVGYFRPWSLAGDRHWSTLVNVVTGPLRECESLVLDLRRSVGGASPEYAEFFIGRSPVLEFQGSDGPSIVNPHWRKPLVMVIDSSTRSGNEVLAFALQRCGIPLVGSRTAGAVTAARPFILSDGSLLLVAARRVTVDGVALEGRGVSPDVQIEAPSAFAQGADPPLVAAMEMADKI
jgi:carboxyl-terminal processing protease